jgi:3-hydroxybutyryl-CoA dehydrogenase
MKILVVGEKVNFDEFKLKFSNLSNVHYCDALHLKNHDIESFEVVFDFVVYKDKSILNFYSGKVKSLFIESSRIQLANFLRGTHFKGHVFGFNGLPSFLNRPLLEACVPFGKKDEDSSRLAAICNLLGTELVEVDDRVGMVTPRVICMIINEAYYTVQEGTSDKKDIDTGMKLGTNYPFGPFEWSEKIGIKNVFEILNCLYTDTHEERYKVCSLLKSEYLVAN